MQANVCLDYTSLVYKVNLTGFDPIEVDHTNCALLCTATFTKVIDSEVFQNYSLSLVAANAIGSSDVMMYPTIIGMLSYFL